uniref:LLM class flavin-dependent oxidoreductase n=1 Tax=Geoglobus ahangari TaxID=113653 RepID=A0A7C3YBY2_9EURY
MTSKNFSKIGKISVNINGDFDDEILLDKLKKIKKIVNTVWIGEADFLKDPFHVAKLFLENSEVYVGFGILRANNCGRIIKELSTLNSDRILIGLAHPNAEIVMNCIKKIKEKYKFPVFCGATGKKNISILSQVADGMLLNHISPKHVSWALKFSKTDFNAAYGPALILPSKFEQDLILAAAIVMGSSKSFLREMGYWDVYQEISKVDLPRLIELRHKGDITHEEDYKILLKHREILLQNFTLSGSFEVFIEKLRDVINLCDHVVLSDPFFREENFDKLLKKIKLVLF